MFLTRLFTHMSVVRNSIQFLARQVTIRFRSTTTLLAGVLYPEPVVAILYLVYVFNYINQIVLQYIMVGRFLI